jgi:hypothetical protein
MRIPWAAGPQCVSFPRQTEGQMLTKRLLLASLLGLSSLAVLEGQVMAADYPPPLVPSTGLNGAIIHPGPPGPQAPTALIYSNSHNYGSVVIDVNIYNNYFGDPTYYWWTYIVRNNSFDPNPGFTNGFSGFELALPVNVPDIANISPTAPWIVNGFSGQPVEWDLRNSGGLGVMPGDTGTFSFSTLPRLISTSSGWFHSWQGDSQTDITNYPPDNAPEVPNVQEAVVPVMPSTWGTIKSLNSL